MSHVRVLVVEDDPKMAALLAPRPRRGGPRRRRRAHRRVGAENSVYHSSGAPPPAEEDHDQHARHQEAVCDPRATQLSLVADLVETLSVWRFNSASLLRKCATACDSWPRCLSR